MENENSYPGQAHEEVTQRVIYKHIMAIAPILFGMLLLCVFFIIAIIYINLNVEKVEQFIPPILVTLIGFVVIAVIVMLTVGTFWIWKRNKVVITNKHVVDVDQIGLFNREVSTLRLEEIQDVSAKINGPLQTMLGYGTLIIQTAGERENFVFDYVPDPYKLENYIIELRSKYYGSKIS
jgi:membrane protein YdbS with pleckstrin-like domain